MISRCWTSWSWDISCCCCICRCCSPGEDLLRSDWSKCVCWTKLTWSCSWSWGINCSSCFLPESASWLTFCCISCCICAGLIAPKGFWRSCCICWRPGGRRGSWRGGGGVTFPGSDSLKSKYFSGADKFPISISLFTQVNCILKVRKQKYFKLTYLPGPCEKHRRCGVWSSTRHQSSETKSKCQFSSRLTLFL